MSVTPSEVTKVSKLPLAGRFKLSVQPNTVFATNSNGVQLLKSALGIFRLFAVVSRVTLDNIMVLSGQVL